MCKMNINYTIILAEFEPEINFHYIMSNYKIKCLQGNDVEK